MENFDPLDHLDGGQKHNAKAMVRAIRKGDVIEITLEIDGDVVESANGIIPIAEYVYREWHDSQETAFEEAVINCRRTSKSGEHTDKVKCYSLMDVLCAIYHIIGETEEE